LRHEHQPVSIGRENHVGADVGGRKGSQHVRRTFAGVLQERVEFAQRENGEALKITVYREPDFSRNVTVKQDGNVIIPLIGDFKAEGLSLSQFSQALQEALSVYIRNPMVTTERTEPSK
jgi:protein involved in polysaccharide export with SLBB domain